MSDLTLVLTNSVITMAQGKPIEERFVDVIDVRKKESDKTGDEIALDIIERAGLKVV